MKWTLLLTHVCEWWYEMWSWHEFIALTINDNSPIYFSVNQFINVIMFCTLFSKMNPVFLSFNILPHMERLLIICMAPISPWQRDKSDGHFLAPRRKQSEESKPCGILDQFWTNFTGSGNPLRKLPDIKACGTNIRSAWLNPLGPFLPFHGTYIYFACSILLLLDLHKIL